MFYNIFFCSRTHTHTNVETFVGRNYNLLFRSFLPKKKLNSQKSVLNKKFCHISKKYVKEYSVCVECFVTNSKTLETLIILKTLKLINLNVGMFLTSSHFLHKYCTFCFFVFIFFFSIRKWMSCASYKATTTAFE